MDWMRGEGRALMGPWGMTVQGEEDDE